MFLYLLISLFPLFLIKSIFENYSLSWVISRKRDSVHLRVREIREERVDKMLPPDTKFREPRDSLKRKGLGIQREGFFPVSSCLEGPSPKLFISHRIFTNVNCFLPGFTNLQVMLQGITSIYWLLAATELSTQHSNSHEVLEARPISWHAASLGSSFPTPSWCVPCLWNSLQKTTKNKKIRRAGQKNRAWASVPSMRG